MQLRLFFVLALMAGCSSGEPSVDRVSQNPDNHPPIVKSVNILPTPVALTGPLNVRVEAQDLDQQAITFRYRWLVNGQTVTGQSNAVFPPERLKQGDQVVVEVTPFDGIVEGTPFQSKPAVVGNSPPIISRVSVEYDLAVQGRQLVATADVVDPDHDEVVLTYRWLQNDKVLKEGESNTIEASALLDKNPIQVEVTATDGKADGVTTVKEQFLVANSLPKIVSNPPSVSGDGQYTYLVQANDADGDPISYALEVGPPGMTIDAKSGQLTWHPSPEEKGVYSVRVVAKDSQGGFAAQEFELSLAKKEGQS